MFQHEHIALKYASRHGWMPELLSGMIDEPVPGVRLYCGVNEQQWNHHEVVPGPYACVSPVFGKKEGQTPKARESRVYVPPGTLVLQDSGAFCDGPGQRLDFWGALQRQLKHGRRYEYDKAITHRASYDVLIDEVWTDGNRAKRRWDEVSAERAVHETIAAAEWLASNRKHAARSMSGEYAETGLVLSAQGVTPRQYLRCVERILPLIDPEKDILGLGGWCITGLRRHEIFPVLQDTLALIMPVIAASAVRHVHIWGVIYPQALGELLWHGHTHGILISTDSAGPAMNPAAFGRWGYGDWVDKNYVSPPPGCQCEKLGRCRGKDRAEHVRVTRSWLERLYETRYFQVKPPF